jgi:arylsulfatase A-like enzyme
MDILPTVLDVTGASYPTELRGNAILPPEGTSLVPVMRGGRLPQRTLGFEHQGARALRQGDWKLVWSKRMPHDIEWQLYNLAKDRCETRDLAAEHPERVKAMAAQWEQWARRVQVIYEPPPATDGPQASAPTASAYSQPKAPRSTR